MPLIKCPEPACERMVSDHAENCPGCGHPIQKARSQAANAAKDDVNPFRASAKADKVEVDTKGVSDSFEGWSDSSRSEASSLIVASKEEADIQHSSRRRSKSDLQELREKAENWVNGYTATAVGTVLATALIPGAATGILCALEVSMCLKIGQMYDANFSSKEAAAAAGTIGLAALAGKIAAMEAAILTGPFAFAVKPAIAGGIVKGMGQLVSQYFEDREQNGR